MVSKRKLKIHEIIRCTTCWMIAQTDGRSKEGTDRSAKRAARVPASLDRRQLAGACMSLYNN